MSGKQPIATCLIAGVFAVAGVFVLYTRAERLSSRKSAVESLRILDAALASSDQKRLLNIIAVPAAVQARTPEEKSEFLRKALLDEVSPEGIRVLAKEGTFGPLAVVFSNEAAKWAGQARVNMSNCVAFRLEKNGVLAEVAIATNGTPRVIRCNNVKQMAGL